MLNNVLGRESYERQMEKETQRERDDIKGMVKKKKYHIVLCRINMDRETLENAFVG